MAGNILAWLVFVAFTLFFGWLTWRAWKARRAWVKWPGVVLAGLLTLACLGLSSVIGRGLYILYMPRNYPVADIRVAGTPEQIARGEHLAAAVCAPCHSASGELPLTLGHSRSHQFIGHTAKSTLARGNDRSHLG